MLESIYTFRWCADESCSSGQTVDKGLDQPRVTCRRPECNVTTCYVHHGAWHEGQSCVQYQEQIDPSFRGPTNAEMDAHPTIWGRACPGCGIRTIRIDNCPQVTCSVCSTSFQNNILEVPIGLAIPAPTAARFVRAHRAARPAPVGDLDLPDPNTDLAGYIAALRSRPYVARVR
jgi:hypothetical protein